MSAKIFIGSNVFEKLYEVEAVKKDVKRKEKMTQGPNNIEVVTSNKNIYYEM